MQETEKRLQEAEWARQEQVRKTQEYKERLEAQATWAAMKEQEEIRDARILFMLGEGYTEAELRRQRAALMRAFHPDNKHVLDPAYAQKINDAYNFCSGI